MATVAPVPLEPSQPGPVLGVSIKGLVCDDPLACLIQAEFVDRVVNPKNMMLYLPHDLLTESDEDRIATVQDSRGREDAARLLLSLVAQRGNWVPHLQAGLRHHHVRLGDLADRIDQLTRQVPMEIDFDDNDLMGMEVDAETFDTSLVPSPEALAMLGGRLPRHLQEHELRAYQQLVLAEISRHFFTDLASSPADVQVLTECYERIASVVTTQYAVGCLEVRLSFDTSSKLRHFRDLVEGELFPMMMSRSLLTSKRREWLQNRAKLYGLKWKDMKVKVTVRKGDLARCERALKVFEEKTKPRSPGEALLRKTALKLNVEEKTGTGYPVSDLPKLLHDFLEWLLDEHPQLAEAVAAILVEHPLDTGLAETMATCRQFFGVSSEHNIDLAQVMRKMMDKVETKEDTHAQHQHFRFQGNKPLSFVPLTRLSVEVEPQSQLEERVKRLVEAKLMIALDPAEENCYAFSSPFVFDFALMGMAKLFHEFPRGFTALKHGSSFAILHLLDLSFFLMLPKKFQTGVRADHRFGNTSKHAPFGIKKFLINGILRGLSSAEQPREVLEMVMACFVYLSSYEIFPLFDWCSVNFGREWKIMARHLMSEGVTLPPFKLAKLTSEEKTTVKKIGVQVLNAKHTIDLTGELENSSLNLFRVALACAQLSNVALFDFEVVEDYAALKTRSDKHEESMKSSTASGQPGLVLHNNMLLEQHIECLLDALPGLESLSLLDLTGCTVSPHHLQRLLDSLPALSMKTLVLSKITFSVSGGWFLPKFQHLKRLQSLDLGYLGLRDEHVAGLVLQLVALHDLHELTLEHNPLTTAGLSALTPALASRDSLRVLRLSHCQLDAGAAFVLGAMLTSSHHLHVLNLSNCSLQDSGLQHLSLVLKDHTHLTKVSLRSGQYTPQGLASFLSHLAECRRMQHLEIGQCPVETDGFDVSDRLIKALEASRHWDFLGLWQCRLGHTDFTHKLLTLHTQLRGLTTLVLQDNHLDDERIAHLAKAAKQGVFRYLKHLNLCQNEIAQMGAECLSDALQFLPRLKELLLQQSLIPPPATVTLSLAMLGLPDATLLDLCDSYAMDSQQVYDVMQEVYRIVEDERVEVREGMMPTDRETVLEATFLEENMTFLGPTTSESVNKDDAYDAAASTRDSEQKDEFSDELGFDIPHMTEFGEPEEVYDDCSQYDPGNFKEQSAAQPESAGTTRRYRRQAEMKLGKLIIDDVLCIRFGHS